MGWISRVLFIIRLSHAVGNRVMAVKIALAMRIGNADVCFDISSWLMRDVEL